MIEPIVRSRYGDAEGVAADGSTTDGVCSERIRRGDTTVTTRSRARTFHQTAKALRTAVESRNDIDAVDPALLLAPRIEDIALGMDDIDTSEDAPASDEVAVSQALQQAADGALLEGLHAELRWAESKLAQASERLAEAQEARRKDLVALAVMRRELRASFGCERAYVDAQQTTFARALPTLREREQELASVVDTGVRLASVIDELARVRAERKLVELAVAQNDAQLARLASAETTLEYDVASEAYDMEPDGKTMRELARLRSESARARRAAGRDRTAARELLESLGIDTSYGEVTAVAAFLTAELEGDHRSAERMAHVRAAQVARERAALPESEAAWKAGLRHPVSYLRARRNG
jgi:hypothetical protein